MAQPVVSLENVDRIRGSIKVLEKEEDLWKWLAHTKKMIAKVEGLEEDADLLETLIGGKIMHEKMRKKFLEGNESGRGFQKLGSYLDTGVVQEVILKRERACIQMDMVSGERLELVMYVERKYKLILAREITFRADEEAAWPIILKLIKIDMSTDDLILLTPFAVGADTYGKYIDACEEAEAIIMRKRDETKIVAAMKVVKREGRGERTRRKTRSLRNPNLGMKRRGLKGAVTGAARKDTKKMIAGANKKENPRTTSEVLLRLILIAGIVERRAICLKLVCQRKRARGEERLILRE